MKKSEIDGVSLKKSEGGEAIMKALRENPALRLVTLVTDGRFGLAPEHEDVQVLIHKRQTAERIEKALREREPGVSATDLIQLDTGRVRAGLAPYLVRASAPTTTPGMLRKGDDALARAAAWLDAVAASENGAAR